MAIVQSFGALYSTSTKQSLASSPGTSVSGGGARPQTYAQLYRTQPNVRTVVDFLARGIASLGLHAYRRVSDTDRVRLIDHDVIQWITHPNPGTTKFRLIESLMCDLGVYYSAFWAKVRLEDRIGLVRLPPEQVTVTGGLVPRSFTWTNPNGTTIDFQPSEIVQFSGYDPANPLTGLSPLETLRRILAEGAAANANREAFWNNGARFEGVIERPLAAPKWKIDQGNQWRQQWQAAYGPGGARVGQVAVLDEGMTYKAISFSAKETEYYNARKLSREECAAAYHVPLPLVGILEHATFSNIREQHKHLYQDCFGPWLDMMQDEFERQLMPDSSDRTDVYLEFNIAEKLRGDFEEQANALRQLAGRPIMTANEARARLNLPRDPAPESDQIAPQQGGPATLPAASDEATEGEVVEAEPETENAEATVVIQAHHTRQRAKLLKHDVLDRPDVFVSNWPRWRQELETDLTPLVGARASGAATSALVQMLASLRTEAMNHHG